MRMNPIKYKRKQEIEANCDYERVRNLALAVGMPLSSREGGWMWDGKTFRFEDLLWNTGMSPEDFLHEIAHWLVAPISRRRFPEFGLGIGTQTVLESWDERRRRVTYKTADMEEARASLLGVAYAYHIGLKWEEEVQDHQWFEGDQWFPGAEFQALQVAMWLEQKELLRNGRPTKGLQTLIAYNTGPLDCSSTGKQAFRSVIMPRKSKVRTSDFKRRYRAELPGVWKNKFSDAERRILFFLLRYADTEDSFSVGHLARLAGKDDAPNESETAAALKSLVLKDLTIQIKLDRRSATRALAEKEAALRKGRTK